MTDYTRAMIKKFGIERLPRFISKGIYGSYVGCLEGYKRDAQGKIVQHIRDYNLITDHGKQDILELFYAGIGGNFDHLYLGLANSAIVASSLLGNIIEVAGQGYSRSTLSRDTLSWPSRGIVGSDWVIQSSSITFQATGSWTTANYAFLCSVSQGTQGRLWNFVVLSAPVSLMAGEQFTYSYKITLR